MSNLEHLMENALCAQQKIIKREMSWKEAKQDFCSRDYNISMASMENISLNTVWDMASYVTYTWCEGKDIDVVFGWVELNNSESR